MSDDTTRFDPDRFRCPECRARLKAASSDALICEGPQPHRFPIVRGIARFAGESYIESFGIQWNRYDVVRPAMDEATFMAKTGVRPSDLAGLDVLDAGVGGGRYALLAGSCGARVVGLDLSSAVEKARDNCRNLPDVVIVQGDLLKPPLAEAAFDFAWSIGVMHHCPNPRKAFAEVARAVKPGGRMAIWLYRRNTWPQEVLNSLLRAITTRMPDSFLRGWARLLTVFGGIPGFKQVGSKIVNFSTFEDPALRLCDNYDWYAPTYQSHHTLNELRQWFLEEGFDEPVELRPEKSGRLYEWAYDRNLIIGSGVNMMARKREAGGT